MPLGVYDEPPPPDMAGAVDYVTIPDDLGPLRLREYGIGLRALTRARDAFLDLLP